MHLANTVPITQLRTAHRVGHRKLLVSDDICALMLLKKLDRFAEFLISLANSVTMSRIYRTWQHAWVKVRGAS